ncbi:MAG: DNA repair protein RecN [Flavobacteriales bacterium]|nr:DNA repair protein RecN [Flavobacteriales bacterium]
MLLHLSITNYAIIEKLEIDFNNGFTVITGETGAGKSILLGALSLILGQRVDTSVLNDKEKKCLVEGIFKISKENFTSFFNENDLDFEEETTIRREISTSGKSRAFINDTPVNLNVIKDLAEQLINIHSQHQNLLVKDGNYQMAIIDSFANIQSNVEDYKKKYLHYVSKRNELEKLKNNDWNSKTDLDFLKFQASEIEALKLQLGEQTTIEEQLKLLNSVEDIKMVLHQATNLLVDKEESILVNLKQIIQSFSKITDLLPEYKTLYERLNSVSIELNDIAREVNLLNDNTNFDKENADYLNNRLSSIYSLEKKHRLSHSDELLSFLNELNYKIAQINSADDVILDLEKEVVKLESELRIIAKQLTETRKKIIPNLCQKITTNLKELGMPEATFNIQHQLNTELGMFGIDKIEFLFSANKGFNTVEIYKVASGGELSRLMLTLKSLLVKSKNLSTIIFDEIDTGVSGDIADKMGNMMKQMSEDIQILTITHLPQVAAKGQQHLKIYKTTNDNKTVTSLSILSPLEKVEEIAKMLSGKELTKAALENARNLISN